MKIAFYHTASGKSPIVKYIDGIGVHGWEFEPVEFRHLKGSFGRLSFGPVAVVTGSFT